MAFNKSQIRSILTNGYFAVNKPKNMTSVEVLMELKSILRKDIPSSLQPPILKLGHGGTLDPTATGVLAVGVGWGCKVLPLLLHGEKQYVAKGCFGTATDTYNETGNVIQKMRYDHISKELFEETLKKYVGNINQIPPKYSALKLHGKRIGDWTRDGIDIKMKPRPVVCYSVRCTYFSLPNFQIQVSCGGGFYIRSLVHDLGQDLSSCAHVTSLHRTMHGPFTEEDMLDKYHWNGHIIVQKIYEARLKYSNVLLKSRAKIIAKHKVQKA